MDWILDHLQVVIAIAAAIAYWLNNQRKHASGDEAPGEDADEAERTRRIQEEIRRRIAERQGGQVPARPQSPSRPASPPPLLRPRPAELPMPPFGAPPQPVFAPRTRQEERQEEVPTFLTEDESARTAAQTAAILARQEQLAAEMRALEAARVEARKRAAKVAAAEATELAREQREARSLASDLRDVKNLRRAVVLREVLNSPVGLR